MSRSSRKFLFGAPLFAGLAFVIYTAVLYQSAPQMLAWKPPQAPLAQGVLAPNTRLQKVRWFGKDIVKEAEDIAFDPQGRLYTGCIDGTIWRFDSALASASTKDAVVAKPTLFAKTGGRPLGMVFSQEGTLYLADAIKGLLAISPNGQIKTLLTGYQSKPFRFLNEIDLDPQAQALFFTDASRLVGIFEEHRLDIASGVGSGRLFRYDLRTGQIKVLLDGLFFANGVALAPDRASIWIAETARYRILRYWRRGPKAGKVDIFAENLPGFPDNISRSPNGGLWVALASTRVSLLDQWLHPHPRLKRLVFALPSWMRPAAQRHGYALHLDANGKITETLQDPTGRTLSNVTSVIEHNTRLYFGQIYHHAHGIAALPRKPSPPPSDRSL